MKNSPSRRNHHSATVLLVGFLVLAVIGVGGVLAGFDNGTVLFGIAAYLVLAAFALLPMIYWGAHTNDWFTSDKNSFRLRRPAYMSRRRVVPRLWRLYVAYKWSVVLLTVVVLGSFAWASKQFTIPTWFVAAAWILIPIFIWLANLFFFTAVARLCGWLTPKEAAEWMQISQFRWPDSWLELRNAEPPPEEKHVP